MLHSSALLIATVFSLGMRHGLDLDHLATIDAISRTLPPTNRLAKRVGLFFSLGHGIVVLLLGLILTTGLMQSHFPAWLADLGNWISIIFLLIFGVLSLQHNDTQKRRSDHGIPSHLFPFKRIKHYSPWLIMLVGALFAISFDTFTQVALFSISATRSIGFASLLGGCFMLGMMATDGLNGFFIGTLIQRADKKSVWISRGLRILIGLFSLMIGTSGVIKQCFSRVC